VIRTFIALPIASAVRVRITAALTQLGALTSNIRLIKEENFHLTVKFLGPLNESRIDSICETVREAVRPFPPFTISAKGLGVFPNVKRARILWVGLQSSDLQALAGRLEAVLEPLGFPREARMFSPHLTVGRWNSVAAPREVLADELRKWEGFEFGASPVEEVIVFESVLNRNGAVYRPLERIRLAHDLQH
jgi:RNA 2',3'-cyclic 3'-phosphodiesterase